MTHLLPYIREALELFFGGTFLVAVHSLKVNQLAQEIASLVDIYSAWFSPLNTCQSSVFHLILKAVAFNHPSPWGKNYFHIFTDEDLRQIKSNHF